MYTDLLFRTDQHSILLKDLFYIATTHNELETQLQLAKMLI